MTMQIGDEMAEWIEPLLRWGQFLTSLTALAFLNASYTVVEVTYNGGDSKLHETLATPTTNFILILTYSSLMYSMWSALIMHGYRFAELMTPCTSLCIDGAFAIAYLAGSIAFVCLPFHRHCSYVTKGGLVHCDNMTISIAFCWVTFVLFFTTFAWTGWLALQPDMQNKTTNQSVQEHEAETSEAVYSVPTNAD